MSLTALRKLVESSKATVLVGVTVVMAAMVYMGHLNAEQFLDAIKVLVPGWMVAHAGETGAKALANGKASEPAAAAPAPADPDERDTLPPAAVIDDEGDDEDADA